MKLDVVLLPDHLERSGLPQRSVVVFDVLRATTTMTAALAAGVREIEVYPNTEAARRAAHGIGLYPAPLLCGEEKCLPPEGFDLGNSPAGFTRGHAGRTIFMSTTNGTRAILAAAEAKLLLVGGLVNASAVAAALAEVGNDVILLCAGTNGRPAMEDLLGAAAVLSALKRLTPVTEESDLPRIALRLFDGARNDLRQALAESSGGRNVIAAGLEADIDFAASVDRFPDVVARVEGQRTVRRMA